MDGKHATNGLADKAGLEQTGACVSSQRLLLKAHMATPSSLPGSCT